MKTSISIDTYIADFPSELQVTLNQLREVIRKAAPNAIEAIKYGIPTFVQNSKNLVHFGGYKNHIGFYPTPSGIEAFRSELAPYKLSKGTIQFSLDQPVPFDLITRIVEFRIAQTAKKGRSKK